LSLNIHSGSRIKRQAIAIMNEIRILLVDDEINLCELISRGLKKISKSYNVSYVGAGQEALDFLQENEVDVLITDIRMPGMDGLELLDKVRELYQDLPAIVLTGHGDLENAIKALRLGAANYIKKPVSFELLHYSIAKSIEKRELSLQVRESEQKYRYLYENAIMGVGITTRAGELVEANEALFRMLGFPEGGAAGLNLNDVYVKEHVREELQDILDKNNKVENYEVESRKKDAPNFWMNLSIRPITLQNQSLLLSTTNDITERKKIEEELQSTVANMRKALEGTVQVVSAMVELRDPYTAGHQMRVAELARAIAKEMELDNNTIEGIYLAGVIHDLGKISVPFEILGKPSQLTNTEFSLIKIHPKVGYDVLKNFAFPWPIADIVHQHHERLDGSGYPMGLEGDDILLEARILSVADVVEAIATHRPYRPALGVETALNEILEHRESRYDPDVVDVCIRLFRELEYKFD